MRLRVVWALFLASVLLEYHKILEHLSGRNARRDEDEARRIWGFLDFMCPPGLVTAVVCTKLVLEVARAAAHDTLRVITC